MPLPGGSSSPRPTISIRGRIVLADDDADLLRALARTLERAGHDVVRLSDSYGREGTTAH